jgi:protein-tyrosine phosphatase
MLSFFGKKKPDVIPEGLSVDIHSHLLPSLDDGAANLEESLDMLRSFEAMGYTKLVTTPHIIADFYPNGPDTILPGLAILQEEITSHGIGITLSAAAEYYLEDGFVEAVEKNADLLSFGEPKYVLFETAFINEPANLRTIIFKLFANGYTPVLAHPERYQYFFDAPERVEDIFDSGVLFQINYLSFLQYYAPPVTKLAEYLVDTGRVHFLGSDCHKPRHIEAMKGLAKSKYWKKALEMPLLNRTL